VVKLSSFVAIDVSLIVMLSSQAMKFSSWAAAELTVVVVAVELTDVVVAMAKLTSVVVAATQVAAVVVMMTQEYTIDVVVASTQVATIVVVTKLTVVVVVALSLNWKIQSLPCQTQCPACVIGHDSQYCFQVYIHHSL
jgi:hypothetical protein